MIKQVVVILEPRGPRVLVFGMTEGQVHSPLVINKHKFVHNHTRLLKKANGGITDNLTQLYVHMYHSVSLPVKEACDCILTSNQKHFLIYLNSSYLKHSDISKQSLTNCLLLLLALTEPNSGQSNIRH